MPKQRNTDWTKEDEKRKIAEARDAITKKLKAERERLKKKKHKEEMGYSKPRKDTWNDPNYTVEM